MNIDKTKLFKIGTIVSSIAFVLSIVNFLIRYFTKSMNPAAIMLLTVTAVISCACMVELFLIKERSITDNNDEGKDETENKKDDDDEEK